MMIDIETKLSRASYFHNNSIGPDLEVKLFLSRRGKIASNYQNLVKGLRALTDAPRDLSKKEIKDLQIVSRTH